MMPIVQKRHKALISLLISFAILFLLAMTLYYRSKNNATKTPTSRHYIPQLRRIALLRIHEKLLGESICPRSEMNVAIVMPFIFKHLALIDENLQTWMEFFPCSSTFVQSFVSKESPSAPFHHKVKFYFYFNNGYNATVERSLMKSWKKIKDQKYNGDSEKISIQDCFAGTPEILWAGLDEKDHNHTIGTAKQFVKLFDIMSEKNIHYFYQMEPDTWPVKERWAEKIYHESVCGESFWMKGSTFRKARYEHFKYLGEHLNGNALYNSHDPQFSSWLNVTINNTPGWAYDLVLADELRLNHEFYRDHSHLFLHIDWFYNHGNKGDVRKPWDYQHLTLTSPNTYLVHGKKEFAP